MRNYVLAKQAAHIFRLAAQYIDKYGWQESGMGEDGKSRCSMGALASVWPRPIMDNRLGKLMYDALYRELGGISLTEFNHRATGGKDVVLLLQRTAAQLIR